MIAGGSIIRYPFSNLEFHWGYYLASILLGLTVGLTRRKWRYGALAGYLFFVLSVTLFSRPISKESIHLVPFWSYKSGLTSQILAKILLFVPLGVLERKHALLTAFFLSFAIELLQLITWCGMFDVDDIISNVLGAMIGIVVSWIGGVYLRWLHS